MKFTDYRQILRSALADRQAKNSAYSLRAFARQTGMSPSHLSRVMRGEKALSIGSALKIAMELSWSHRETETFLDLLQLDTTDPKDRDHIRARIEKKAEKQLKRQINLEKFRVVADWYHLPMVDLITAKGCETDPTALASAFGLPVYETRAALDRLVSVGILECRSGIYYPIEREEFETTDDVPSTAIRKHHQQTLERAIKALEDQNVNERENRTHHLVFPTSRMPAAKKRIRDFVTMFNQEFGANSGEEVYTLSVNFFRTTKKSLQSS